MSMRIVVSCDGHWPIDGDGPSFPCRGALPTTTTIAQLAHEDACAAGWSMSGDRDDLDDRDLCPAHARIHNATHSGAQPQTGPDLRQ